MKQRAALLKLLCRICGQEDRNCVSVFTKEGISQSIQKKMRTCLTISVEDTDQLPKQICFACLNKLDTAYDLLRVSKEGKILINQKLHHASGNSSQDSSLCGVCNKIVEDNQLGLGCEGQCQRWFHITCANVNRLQYHEFVQNPTKVWICGNCKYLKPSQETVPNTNQSMLINSIDIKLSSLKENAPIKFGETALISLAPCDSPPPTKEVVAPTDGSLIGMLQPSTVMVNPTPTDNGYLQAPSQVAYPIPVTSKQEVYPQSLIQVNSTSTGKPVVYQLNNERSVQQPTRAKVVPKPMPATTLTPAKRRALRENIPKPKKTHHTCKYCHRSFHEDIIDHHVSLHLRKSFSTCLDCNRNFRSEECLSKHRCTASDTSAAAGPINLTEDSDDEPILL